MKTLLMILTAYFVACTASAQIDLVTLPASESSQVTIYNSKDLTLVRDTRRLTLKQGLNTLQFDWSNTLIDPTSISIRPLKDADKIDVLFLTYPARVRQVGQWQIISEVGGADAWELDYVDPASTAEDAISYKKHDKSRARFTMTVRPQSEKTFGHTIRKYRKKRIEAYVQKLIEQEQEKNSESVMPDLIRHPDDVAPGPRIKSGVTH